MLLASLTLLAALSGPTLALPSAPGTVWRYTGTVRWTLENSNVVREARIEWCATVVLARSSGRSTAVVVRGFPTDLAWFEPGKTALLTILTSRPDGLFLAEVPDEARIQEQVAAILAGGDAGEHILRSSPRLGDRLGATPGRTDGMYCWRVERRVRFKGHSGWSVAYRTNPDHQVLQVVPGVGITAFTYEHHGTVASAFVRLTTVQPPPAPNRLTPACSGLASLAADARR